VFPLHNNDFKTEGLEPKIKTRVRTPETLNFHVYNMKNLWSKNTDLRNVFTAIPIIHAFWDVSENHEDGADTFSETSVRTRFEVFAAVTMKTNYEEDFEGSQALSVCPSGKYKLLTGTIEV
jgi:hypothetical protein